MTSHQTPTTAELRAVGHDPAQRALPVWGCTWCAPGLSWCTYHANDPALRRYVTAGYGGWLALGDAHHAHHGARLADAERRRLFAASFTTD